MHRVLRIVDVVRQVRQDHILRLAHNVEVGQVEQHMFSEVFSGVAELMNTSGEGLASNSHRSNQLSLTQTDSITHIHTHTEAALQSM